ncbi:hypothetical protein [Microlunatus speluncae]|uniref:hypothetical protein n=1 Tax=Microlunatus speluncae TaxID=2594267 RepID=UPI00126657D0|nr:hypothetical protein [Microlunatus speluncae]
MEIGLVLGVFLVLALLLPPYLIARNHQLKARQELGGNPAILAGFDATRAGPRPVLTFVVVTLFLLVGGLAGLQVITRLIEPRATDAAGYALIGLFFFGVPVLVALILIGLLISLTATGRARFRYLEGLVREQPDLPGVSAAAELVRRGGLPGVAVAATVATLACLALGLGWIAFLFSMAGYAIQCTRSNSKCL